MIKISKQNNSLIVEGIENAFYINNGDNSYPLNSLIVVTDKSDMATFRSVATNDVLFSGLINNITINGEVVTKDNIIAKFDAVSNSSTGGGTVDAYTKEEADNKFASKDELTNVQTVANDADTKVDALTPRVEGVETAMGNKQDTLVSGTNIKTINSQSIIGSGDLTISGVSDEQAQEIAKIPTIETELAQKANVSDVPTVQTGRRGTNKNYVYSNADTSNNNDKVLSKCTFIKRSPNRLEIDFAYWGDEGYRLQLPIPLVTSSTAGIMSGNDKTKLDSIPETIPSQSEIDGITANVSALQTAMGNKQDTLVSGTNIKTINSQSILGEGNIEVSGVSEEQAQEIAKIPTLETEIAQKANVSDVPTAQILSDGTNKNYIYSDVYSTYAGVISNIELNHLDEQVNIKIYKWTTDASKPSYTTEFLSKATTTSAGVMSAADKTKLDSISNEWTGTQSEYDALATKEDNIIYYVTE